MFKIYVFQLKVESKSVQQSITMAFHTIKREQQDTLKNEQKKDVFISTTLLLIKACLSNFSNPNIYRYIFLSR